MGAADADKDKEKWKNWGKVKEDKPTMGWGIQLTTMVSAASIALVVWFILRHYSP